MVITILLETFSTIWGKLKNVWKKYGYEKKYWTYIFNFSNLFMVIYLPYLLNIIFLYTNNIMVKC